MHGKQFSMVQLYNTHMGSALTTADKAWIGGGVGLAVVMAGAPALAMALGPALSSAGENVVVRPPPQTFAAVWTVLYVLAAAALVLQLRAVVNSTANRQQGIAALVLVVCAVAVSYGWPAIWNASTRGDVPLGAPAWAIAAMLAAIATAAPLASSGVITCLWMPWLVWCAFALLLASMAVQTTRTPGASSPSAA